jgi:hypothetical protein
LISGTVQILQSLPIPRPLALVMEYSSTLRHLPSGPPQFQFRRRARLSVATLFLEHVVLRQQSVHLKHFPFLIYLLPHIVILIPPIYDIGSGHSKFFSALGTLQRLDNSLASIVCILQIEGNSFPEFLI